MLGTEWKANLIRWQITRNWGRAGTELDLAEYDRWIDAKLEELDQVMPACAKYGIKVVIDPHTPPGGRDESMDMTTFYDRKYQDHFVAVWERIARRYKGQPALWGYDLVNEPVCAGRRSRALDSLATQVRAARAIRRIDPATPILIAADQWDSPGRSRGSNPWTFPTWSTRFTCTFPTASRTGRQQRLHRHRLSRNDRGARLGPGGVAEGAAARPRFPTGVQRPHLRRGIQRDPLGAGSGNGIWRTASACSRSTGGTGRTTPIASGTRRSLEHGEIPGIMIRSPA
ncbi:MAG: cellulase family glycosylhydrolase [Kiritimatiellia bacterium]